MEKASTFLEHLLLREELVEFRRSAYSFIFSTKGVKFPEGFIKAFRTIDSIPELIRSYFLDGEPILNLEKYSTAYTKLKIDLYLLKNLLPPTEQFGGLLQDWQKLSTLNPLQFNGFWYLCVYEKYPRSYDQLSKILDSGYNASKKLLINRYQRSEIAVRVGMTIAIKYDSEGRRQFDLEEIRRILGDWYATFELIGKNKPLDQIAKDLNVTVDTLYYRAMIINNLLDLFDSRSQKMDKMIQLYNRLTAQEQQSKTTE